MKKKIFFWFLVILAFIAIAAVLVLNYGYSNGNRTGKLVQISKVGYMYKTYEGTLDLGSGEALTWLFSVHDDNLGDELLAQTGKEVTLHYKEHLFKVFYNTKFNVYAWELSRGGEHDFLCRLVDVMRDRPDVVSALRPIMQERDPELLREVRRCQKLQDGQGEVQ